ncbi:hypothetical protein GLYMA_16G105700v4 [Glycine max]|uniref:RNase H type-1 domain-containing protein n=2 Tax=Glycine subgen. Soja TaxID=1462606 RepID=A0A0R0FP39_SOYBN|nr:hypothetical protein JHK87_044861 [Glycine soja]KAG4951773.1 hypothetical protein JHK85_045640 [Glycine max]KAG5108220.1 hypothetical protein JHK84_045127 [Glycine max]KAH1150865.1 hypothetical protein GYH30_044736 [Glycine max]KRH07713.1 hypothetical protein GLYMA_16G105700v4 [Glycine max]
MDFVTFHIFREGNQCVDKLANFGINSHGFLWCIPTFLSEQFARIGLVQLWIFLIVVILVSSGWLLSSFHVLQIFIFLIKRHAEFD